MWSAHFLPVCDVLLESSGIEIGKHMSQHSMIHVNNRKHLRGTQTGLNVSQLSPTFFSETITFCYSLATFTFQDT